MEQVLAQPGPQHATHITFTADEQGTEILTNRKHEMSADCYGPVFAEDFERLMRGYRR
jgi:hypothetical protein